MTGSSDTRGGASTQSPAPDAGGSPRHPSNPLGEPHPTSGEYKPRALVRGSPRGDPAQQLVMVPCAEQRTPGHSDVLTVLGVVDRDAYAPCAAERCTACSQYADQLAVLEAQERALRQREAKVALEEWQLARRQSSVALGDRARDAAATQTPGSSPPTTDRSVQTPRAELRDGAAQTPRAELCDGSAQTPRLGTCDAASQTPREMLEAAAAAPGAGRAAAGGAPRAPAAWEQSLGSARSGSSSSSSSCDTPRQALEVACAPGTDGARGAARNGSRCASPTLKGSGPRTRLEGLEGRRNSEADVPGPAHAYSGVFGFGTLGYGRSPSHRKQFATRPTANTGTAKKGSMRKSHAKQ